jgi:macrolide transport system ATP-binding/permease protein
MRWPADIRYALRTLAQNPGFTSIAILSLALGIGATSAMFSYVDAVLLRPLPVPHPGDVIEAVSTAPGIRFGAISYPDYVDYRDQSRTAGALVCYTMTMMGVTPRPEATPRVTLGMLVSGNFFSGLGIAIPVGRSFRADEDQVAARDLVAIVSYSFWQNQFASDRNAIGRKIRINGSEFTVIGVAPEGFTGPESYVQNEIYVPMHAFAQAMPSAPPDYLTSRGSHIATVLGTLNPGVQLAQARAELTTIADSLAARYPETNRERKLFVATHQAMRFQRSGLDATFALSLAAIAGLVLLIACANVANLVLARGAARVKEIAIRMAIGASRTAVVRQMLVESFLLATAGAAAGLGVAYAGVRFLNSIPLPSDFPLAFGARMDSRMLAFSFAAAVATSFIVGFFPALRTSRADLVSTIKSGDQGPSRVAFWRGRLAGRNILVTVQLTISVLLLVLSSFFVRGFQTARRMDIGFRLDRTLFFSLDPSLMRYDQAHARRFRQALRERLLNTTGVSNASFSWTIPFDPGNQRQRRVILDGQTPAPGREAPMALFNIVDDRYFGLMETKLVSGRAIDSRDTADSPRVAVINQTLARRLWPNRDAIGQRMQLDNTKGPAYQVIGVARDAKYIFWAEPPTGMVWTSFAQEYDPHMFVEIRTAGDPSEMASIAREQVRALDPDMPVTNLHTMQEYFHDRAILPPRILAQVVTALGLVGLLLAVIGLYGVVAYAVTRRTREIGIRMAIGARPRDVLRMVLGQGMMFTAIGCAAGIALTVSVAGYFQDLATGVNPRDPLSLAVVPLILATVMLAASWIPARRAARVEPTRALRLE